MIPPVEKPAHRANALLVLGAHRSGTSAIAEGLLRLGVPGPNPSRFMLADRWNPRGYFEETEFIAINEALLESMDAHWFSPPAEVDASQPLSEALTATMCACLDSPSSEDEFVLRKDPRLCLTLPFWKPLYSKAVAVQIWRHPAEVADSLLVRDYLPPAASFLLWEVYNRCALTYAHSLPHLLVSHANLMQNPEIEFERISEFLKKNGVLKGPPDIPSAVAAIDPKLARTQAGLSAAVFATARTGSQNRLLADLEQGRNSPPDYPLDPMPAKGVLSIMNAVRLREVEQLTAQVAQLTAEVKKLQACKLAADSYAYLMNKPSVRAYRSLKRALGRLTRLQNPWKKGLP